MQFEKNLLLYIKSKANIIQIVTSEYLRVHGAVNEVSKQLGLNWYVWNRIEGLKKWNLEERKHIMECDSCRESSDIIEKIIDTEDNGIYILEEFHHDLAEPRVQQRLKNFFSQRHNKNSAIILTQSIPNLPKELEKEIVQLEMPLPSKEDLKVILESICSQENIHLPDNSDDENKILEAALGLTIMEAELAFRKAIESQKKINLDSVPLIASEKESVIKKSGFLEYYHPQEDMDDVGGLDTLKDWLKKRGKAFGLGAVDFGLDTPRGILLLGIPGTGKSLSAKAIANTWKFPLLRLDIGKVYAGIVGASEENIRSALSLAEAISPCVLWIDEIEKGLSGVKSSGSTDGGTSSRVLGTFLTWLQEKKKSVFVVATANDVSQLPPELLRKGRVDEIFFVDLPTEKARKEIIEICLKRKKRLVKDFDLDKLAKESKGFSGAEIDEAIKEGLFTAFDQGNQLNDSYILDAMRRTYPLSKTMAEAIQSLRQWAKARAVDASSDIPESLEDSIKNDKIPKLQQESYNPFIK